MNVLKIEIEGEKAGDLQQILREIGDQTAEITITFRNYMTDDKQLQTLRDICDFVFLLVERDDRKRIKFNVLLFPGAETSVFCRKLVSFMGIYKTTLQRPKVTFTLPSLGMISEFLKECIGDPFSMHVDASCVSGVVDAHNCMSIIKEALLIHSEKLDPSIHHISILLPSDSIILGALGVSPEYFDELRLRHKVKFPFEVKMTSPSFTQ